jgi:uncharacterized tellurite resistance protein B-like protein
MKSYPLNSPQAMSRVVAMMMVTDGELHQAEAEFLERHHAFEALGISSAEFHEVARQYCADLIAASVDVDSIRLIDPERIDRVIACVTDPKKRKAVCQQVLGLIAADGDVDGQETAVFRYVLTMWDFDAEAFLPERNEPAQ